ncbi:hypothetical protein TPA0908_38260 [Micromonospora sp. AKA38]|nr:hypothetical protein TPA0908_38260 [Micromonospora sp. AKA38]
MARASEAAATTEQAVVTRSASRARRIFVRVGKDDSEGGGGTVQRSRGTAGRTRESALSASAWNG